MGVAPARTGRDSNRRIIISKVAYINNGICSSCIPLERIFIVVLVKLTDSMINNASAIYRENIARFTDGSLCIIFLDNGRYIIHPVPILFLIRVNKTSRSSDRVSVHSLRLFRLGKAIFDVLNISGRS